MASRAQSISPPPQSFPPSVTHPMLNHFDPRGFHFGTTPPANSRDLTSREYHHFYPHAIHPSSSSNTSSLCHSHNPHTTQTVYNPHSLQRDSPVTDSTSQQPPIINNWVMPIFSLQTPQSQSQHQSQHRSHNYHQISSSSSMSMNNATGAASTTMMHAHHHAHPNNMFIVPHQMSTGTGVASQTHSHSQHAHGSQNMYIVPSMSLVHANCSSPSTSPSSLSQASLSPLSQTSLSPLSQTPQTPVHSPSSRLTMNSPSRVASKLLGSPSTLSHSLFPESHLSPTSSDPRSLIPNSNLYLPPAISSSSSSSSANSPSSPSRNKHKCEWPGCTWSFKRLEHLKRHNLTHTGERKYKCEHPGCGKKFGRSDNFAAHLKTHNKNCSAVNNGTNNGVSRCSAQGHGTNGNSNCGMLGSFRQGSGRGRRVSGRKSHSIGSMGNIGIGVDVGGMNGFGMGVGMIGDMTVGSVQQTSSMHGNRENYFKTEERLHNHEGHLQA